MVRLVPLADLAARIRSGEVAHALVLTAIQRVADLRIAPRDGEDPGSTDG